MKKIFPRLLLATLIALLFLGGLNLPASASSGGAAKPKLATVVTLSELQPAELGDVFILDGTLKDINGQPVKDRSVLFTLDGQYLGQARTNVDGVYVRKFSKDLDAGSYALVAYWNGTHELASASTTATLVINPTVVKIQTVPAVAGVAFTMANQRVISGPDGKAIVKINRAGEYRLTALVEEYSNPNQRIKFGRWLEESYEPTSIIKVPTDRVVQVGLNVFRRVGQSFLDLDGFPVDAGRISEFMIRSAQGDVFIFHDGQPRWIPSSRIARRVTGLEETKLLYSVISVMIDGSNVVNQSQQRFYTYPTENWPISLLLYSLRITARDGLFGTPVGTSVNVEFPDGDIVNYPLEEDGTVLIHSLARGTYYTELVGTWGMKNRTPVALSRNQDVNTNVITYLDMAVAGLFGALLALGLLLYGRPSLLNLLGWRRKQEPRRDESLPGTGPALPQPALATVVVESAERQIYNYGSLHYDVLRMYDDDEFKRSTGVEREKFEKTLSFLQKEMKNSGRQGKLSHADQLLLTIVYVRENASQFELAPAYSVSVGTVRRAITRVKKALLNSSDFNLLVASIPQPALAMLPAVSGLGQAAPVSNVPGSANKSALARSRDTGPLLGDPSVR